MELAWLEDFLQLAATHNFSSAAAARNISQSAFSRRIKALEGWLGSDLINRSTYPVKLTAAGELFLPHCRELTRDIYRLQTECRTLADSSEKPINFAALRTLAIYFFPGLFSSLAQVLPRYRCDMYPGDFLECIEQLSSGKSDFALIYDHPNGPPVLASGPFESLKVGTDRLILISGTDPAGKALYSVDRPDGAPPLPYLNYTWHDGHLGKLVAMAMSRRKRPLNVVTVYQSVLVESLKHMAVHGNGIVWLPALCVQDELERGELIEIGGPDMALQIDIRLFRRIGYRGQGGEAIWKHLGGETAS